MQGRGEDALPFRFVPRMHRIDPALGIRAPDGVQKLVRIVATEEHVPFRERREQFSDVFFGKAARNDDLFEGAAAVGIAVEHRVDRLLASRFEKGAGVDDKDVRLRNVVGDRVSLRADNPQKAFRVDAVFIATQGDHAEYFVFKHNYSP